MRSLLIVLLRFYQHTISPDTGFVRHWYPYGCCRYWPTCSQYAIDALTRYGTIRGIVCTVRRILRCHPWHEGGIDSVTRP